MQEDYKKLIEEKDKIIEEYKKQIALLKKQVEYYKKTACIDPLTNLNNRRAVSYTSNYSNIIMGDVDHFKQINDEYGHEEGDKVLIEIGKILIHNVRDIDLACRWGGEEFAIFLKDCNEDIAYKKALLLKEKIESLKDVFGFDITMSFGVSNINDKNMQEAITEADQAMYESKSKGRNTVTVYTLN